MAERHAKEVLMLKVTVEYDKYNRTFKLLDREFGSVLEDGGVYDLIIPILVETIVEPEQLIPVPLAHA